MVLYRYVVRERNIGQHLPLVVLWCFGALHYTHIVSSSHLTLKLISAERYEIICV